MTNPTVNDELYYKVTGLRDFDDLIMERILGLEASEAQDVLLSMFPDADIMVFVDRGGNTQIRVDDVKVTVTNESV